MPPQQDHEYTNQNVMNPDNEILKDQKDVHGDPNYTALKWTTSLVIIAVIGIGGYFAWQSGLLAKWAEPEDVFAEVLQNLQETTGYHIELQVELNQDGQNARLQGTMDIEGEKGLAHFTTTVSDLTIITDSIVDGGDYFTRVQITGNSALVTLMKQAMPIPDSWIHFNEVEALPSEYQNLAKINEYNVLSLLQQGGEYIEKISEEEQIENGRAIMHYEVRLSPTLKEVVRDEKMVKLMDTVTQGTIGLWAEKDMGMLTRLEITTDTLSMTQTVTPLHTVLHIERPSSYVSLSEWMRERFFAALPKTKITEVRLGGYGGVGDATMQMIKHAIEEDTGVKTTILANYKEGLPALKGIYDETRKQYDADIAWQFFAQRFGKDGDTIRYIVVLNEDVFTTIQPERPYVVSRALPSTNTILIAIPRLNKADGNTGEIDTTTFHDRVKKIALRTLGVSVSLTMSPDSNNKQCVMYQTSLVPELDAVGSAYCAVTKTALPRVFEQNAE